MRPVPPPVAPTSVRSAFVPRVLEAVIAVCRKSCSGLLRRDEPTVKPCVVGAGGGGGGGGATGAVKSGCFGLLPIHIEVSSPYRVLEYRFILLNKLGP